MNMNDNENMYDRNNENAYEADNERLYGTDGESTYVNNRNYTYAPSYDEENRYREEEKDTGSLRLLIIIITAIVMIYLLIASWQNYYTLTEIKLPIFIREPKAITVCSIMLLAYFFGGCTIALWLFRANREYDSMVHYYKRRLTRVIQKADNNVALIDALQRKVSSLEIALGNAVNNGNAQEGQQEE